MVYVVYHIAYQPQRDAERGRKCLERRDNMVKLVDNVVNEADNVFNHFVYHP